MTRYLTVNEVLQLYRQTYPLPGGTVGVLRVHSNVVDSMIPFTVCKEKTEKKDGWDVRPTHPFFRDLSAKASA